MEEKCSGFSCVLSPVQLISKVMNGEGCNVLIASLLLAGVGVYPVFPSIGISYSCPKATPISSRRLSYIHILSKSEVGAIVQRSEVTCFCTNAEFATQILYKVALIIFLIRTYDGACNSFNIPSYIPNMIAALGTVLRR